jgi:hypothetical protein
LEGANMTDLTRGSLGYWVSRIDTSDPDACWPWPGSIDPSKGYGIAGKREHVAHRAVYKAMVGPIPRGMQIDHSCHNNSGCPGGPSCPHRRCVNWVRHLKPVTPRDNLLSSPNTVNSINAAKTECLRGHEFDVKNTRIRPNGTRACRACATERARRTRREKGVKPR